VKRFDLGVLIAAVAIVAGGGGFALGHFTAKPTTASATTGNNSSGGGLDTQGRGRFGAAGERPTFGTVASVSGNTIVVTNSRTGANVTVNVTSATTYTNSSGAAASLADVTAGTTVAAIGSAGSDGAIAATRILINPSFGGGPAGGGAGTGPDGSSQPD
jgi:hypothetical protein